MGKHFNDNVRTNGPVVVTLDTEIVEQVADVAAVDVTEVSVSLGKLPLRLVALIDARADEQKSTRPRVLRSLIAREFDYVLPERQIGRLAAEREANAEFVRAALAGTFWSAEILEARIAEILAAKLAAADAKALLEDAPTLT